MPDDAEISPLSAESAPLVPAKPLSPVAERALKEAAERRAERERKLAELTTKAEINGRGGLDPVRYDDWEIKGLTSDF